MSTKPLTALASGAHTLRWAQFGSRSLFLTTLAVLLVDSLTFSLVQSLVILGRHLITPGYSSSAFLQFLPWLLATLLAFALQGLYPGLLVHPAEEFRRVFLSVTSVFLLMTCATFLWRTASEYSRAVSLIIWALGFPSALLARYLSRRFFARFPWWGIPAIILGAGPTAAKVVANLKAQHLGIHVVGILSDDWDAPSYADCGAPVIGPISSARYFAQSGQVKIAIITLPIDSDSGLQHTIQDHCKGFSHILLIPNLPGLISLGSSVRNIGGGLGLEIPQRLFHRRSAIAKRCLDLALSGAAVFALAPFLVAIALAVRLSSPGPIFFGQKRCGREGVVFLALKFRTMVSSAEDALEEYLAANPDQRLQWQRDHKLKNDPRITRVGRWIRRFSLDELPQLFNVLLGHMSLVGPRPIVEEEIHRYGHSFGLYSRVNPGITGLWQVSGRNNRTYAERVEFDEFYVNNWSVWLDLYILARTFKAVITAEGAY